MKILSIGNSFSRDAQRYLYKVAKSQGDNFKTVNLYIGGCPLRTHYLNCLEDKTRYAFDFNGEETGLCISIKQALISDEWDVVTLQQASRYSGKFETYIPYLEYLVEYIKKYCPHAKIYIHQTWAYEEESQMLATLGYQTSQQMFDDVEKAYKKAIKLIKADGFIPCGKAMLNATKMGIEQIHRDTYHASKGVGRYLLALTWYKALTGKDISNNNFNEFDEPVSDKDREIVIRAANSAF